MKKDIIESFNRHYKKELCDSIKKLEPYIIEAFVAIYGEKHREYIAYTIRHLKYVYYIPEKYLAILEDDLNGVRNHDKYILNQYMKYFQKLDFVSHSIPDSSLEDFVLKKYIVESDFDFETLIKEKVAFIISDDDPTFTFLVERGKIYKTIFLPIFAMDLKILFHEMNHALTIEAIGIYYNKLLSPTLFSKSIALEIINDYIAYLAYLKYKEISSYIPKYERRFQIYDHYTYYYDYAKLIFEFLGPVILESLISHRPNLFIKLSGEKNYHYLCQLIDYLFKHEYLQEKYEELYRLLEKIVNHILKAEEIDFELYFKQLEDNGYQVRRLKK